MEIEVGRARRGRANLERGWARNQRLQAEGRARVLDALVRASGGVRPVPTRDIQAATRRRGVPLSIAGVKRHLRALVDDGYVERVGGRSPKPTLWRPTAIVRP